MKLDREDLLYILASVVSPLLLWWFIRGERRYSTKGMR